MKINSQQITDNKQLGQQNNTACPVKGLPCRRQSVRTMGQISFNGGFTALMSAIVLSFLLLTVAVTIGTVGLNNRLNISETEFKERSLNLAEGCVDIAISSINDGFFPSNLTITIGENSEDKCIIVSALHGVPAANLYEIKTRSDIQNAVTNLKVVLDKNKNVITWEEVSNF